MTPPVRPDPGRVEAVATLLQARACSGLTDGSVVSGTLLGRLVQLQLVALQLVAHRVQHCLDDLGHYSPARMVCDVAEVLAAADVLLDEARPAWAQEHGEVPLPRLLDFQSRAERNG